jgi:hypothetical protein
MPKNEGGVANLSGLRATRRTPPPPDRRAQRQAKDTAAGSRAKAWGRAAVRSDCFASRVGVILRYALPFAAARLESRPAPSPGYTSGSWRAARREPAGAPPAPPPAGSRRAARRGSAPFLHLLWKQWPQEHILQYSKGRRPGRGSCRVPPRRFHTVAPPSLCSAPREDGATGAPLPNGENGGLITALHHPQTDGNGAVLPAGGVLRDTGGPIGLERRAGQVATGDARPPLPNGVYRWPRGSQPECRGRRREGRTDANGPVVSRPTFPYGCTTLPLLRAEGGRRLPQTVQTRGCDARGTPSPNGENGGATPARHRWQTAGDGAASGASHRLGSGHTPRESA